MVHTVTITGVPRPSGQPITDPSPPRRDIRDLITDEKQFMLYVQALVAMQQMSQNEILSWFKICGIHGIPVTPWDNAQPPSGSWYCHHGVVTFPTWHRPYTALYEQVLNSKAVEIANAYTTSDKQQWRDAATALRAPYWDWASNSVPPPEVIDINTKANLEIIIHDGSKTSIPNPLLTYLFHPQIPPPVPSVAANRPETVRCASTGGTKTNLQALLDSLHSVDWRTSTYNMLTRTTTWNTMSNGSSKSGIPGDRDVVDSLEVIHGSVHVTTGGNGHMSSVPVAAFDPIFWLHHVNVDRVLALWMAMHPGVFMDNTDAASNLVPFWNGANSYWRSSETTGLGVLNYTYPEFVGLQMGNTEAVKRAITDKVNHLYGDEEDTFEAAASMSAPAPQVAAMRSAAPQAMAPQAMAVQATLAQSIASSGSQQGPVSNPASGYSAHNPYAMPHPYIIPERKNHEDLLDWTVRVRSRLHQFDMSYTVLIFIGQPPQSEHEWRTCPEFAGAFMAFVNESPEECTNCREHKEAMVEGFVNITKALHRHQLRSYDAREVEPYLKDRIHWRIQEIDATVVPASEVAALEVAVMSVPLHWDNRDGYYKMAAKPSHHPEITRYHAGGRGASTS